MKKYLVISSMFIMSCIANPSFAVETSTPVIKTDEKAVTTQVPRLHQSAENKYSITLPEGWEVRTGFMGTDVLALSPERSDTDLRENVSVLIVKLDQVIPAEEYYNLNLQGLQKLLTNYKLEKTEHVKIDGADALKLVYTHQMGEIKAKVTQFLFLRDNKAFVITFSAAPENFDKLQPQIDETVSTFKFDQ